MIKEFESFTGNKILRFFLFNPTKEFHINGLARELNIGAGTAKYYCDSFLKENILFSRSQGNQRIFVLNNNYFLVKELKRTFALVWLREKGLEEVISKGTFSMAVYGSFASGEFDNNSDLDLLFLGVNDDIDRAQVSKFSKEIKREVQIVFYSWVKWEKMKKEKHPFAESILKKHILIKGNSL